MSPWDFRDRFDHFPPSVPRQAKGGIRAQSKRGTFGESWWAKRWMQVLDSFQPGGRLSRGRSYARRGQVLSVEVEKGQVLATVQGSRPQPYEVSMQVKVLAAAEWKKVAKAVSSQALFVAKLLASELPAEIEQVFLDEGVSLFPARVSDLRTNCSCPDWSNPCKHVAAVYCLLAEEFDRDPFLIFKMRGMSREEFSAVLADFGGVPAELHVEETVLAEPLCADPVRYWSPVTDRHASTAEAQAPELAAALVKRLGRLPFWRGRETFLEAMESTYIRASAKGLEILNGR